MPAVLLAGIVDSFSARHSDADTKHQVNRIKDDGFVAGRKDGRRSNLHGARRAVRRNEPFRLCFLMLAFPNAFRQRLAQPSDAQRRHIRHVAAIQIFMQRIEYFLRRRKIRISARQRDDVLRQTRPAHTVTALAQYIQPNGVIREKVLLHGSSSSILFRCFAGSVERFAFGEKKGKSVFCITSRWKIDFPFVLIIPRLCSNVKCFLLARTNYCVLIRNFLVLRVKFHFYI